MQLKGVDGKMMDDKKNKDLNEQIVIEEAGGEVMEAGEAMEAAETAEPVGTAPPVAEPKKPGRSRNFFKTKKLAIGISVLAILLVANVAMFGAHKHAGKGVRDHGSKANVECEYKQGAKSDKSEKDYEKRAECGDVARPDKSPGHKDKSQSQKDAGMEKGARGGKEDIKTEASLEASEDMETMDADAGAEGLAGDTAD
jgi:hypothetical protein